MTEFTSGSSPNQDPIVAQFRGVLGILALLWRTLERGSGFDRVSLVRFVNHLIAPLPWEEPAEPAEPAEGGSTPAQIQRRDDARAQVLSLAQRVRRRLWILTRPGLVRRRWRQAPQSGRRVPYLGRGDTPFALLPRRTKQALRFNFIWNRSWVIPKVYGRKVHYGSIQYARSLMQSQRTADTLLARGSVSWVKISDGKITWA